MPHQDDDYAPTAWGQPTTFDFVTPGGQRCLLRKLEMPDILALGIMDEIDSLTGISGSGPKQPMDHQKSRKQLEEEATRSLLADSDKFGLMIKTIDKVVIRCVVRPSLSPEIPEGEEAPIQYLGCIPVNRIDFIDKMAIFEKVFGGLGDLEPFREGPTEGVGTPQAVPEF